MKIIIILFAAGIIVLIGSVIVMWHMFLLALGLVAIMTGASFLVAFCIVDALTNDTELAQMIGVVTATTTLSVIIWFALKSGKSTGP